MQGKDVIWYAGNSINERLLNKGIGPAQIISSNAIWTRNSKVNSFTNLDALALILENHTDKHRSESVCYLVHIVQLLSDCTESNNLRVYDSDGRVYEVWNQLGANR